MLTKEIMQTEVVTVGPFMTLREAGAILAQRGITGAPVVDQEGELVGVVSQTDIVRCGASHEKDGVSVFYRDLDVLEAFDAAPERSEFDVMRVADVMTRHPICVEEACPLDKLIFLMLGRGVHRVLVTRRGKLCGIVTTMDILRAISPRYSAAGRRRHQP